MVAFCGVLGSCGGGGVAVGGGTAAIHVDHVSVLDCHRAHALLASLAAQDLGRESRECYNRSWNELSDL